MVPVFVGTNYWSLNGVNVFCENLTRGLRGQGFDARLLLTEQYTARVTLPARMMTLPGDLPVQYLSVPYDAPWAQRWGVLIRLLERHGRCVYIPNSDYRNSCITPCLSPRVSVVGVAHSHDPLHYDHVARLGRAWNHIVTVSDAIRMEIGARFPELASRTTTIPIGVPVPAVIRPRRGERLRAVYHGVISVRQKRIFDLVELVEKCAAEELPLQLVVAGAGPDEDVFAQRMAPHVAAGRVELLGLRQPGEIGALLDTCDLFLMTSEFEGMPHALLEAMAHGCVPIVTSFHGAETVVREGERGFIVPIGDVDAIADRVKRLSAERAQLAEMAERGRAFVAAGRHSLDAMVRAWAKLLTAVCEQPAEHVPLLRNDAPSLPPPVLDGVSIFPIDRELISGIGEFPVNEYRRFLLERRLGIAGAALRGVRRLRMLRLRWHPPRVEVRPIPWWRIRHAAIRTRMFLLKFVPRPLKRWGRRLLTRLRPAWFADPPEERASAEGAARR